MSKTVLYVLLKVLMLARADSLSEYPEYPDFIQNLESNHSHPDNVSVRNKDDNANMSVPIFNKDLIEVPITHEMSKFLIVSDHNIKIWDPHINDLSNEFAYDEKVISVACFMSKGFIYWSNTKGEIKMFDTTYNHNYLIFKVESSAHNLCIDWITKHLYWTESIPFTYYNHNNRIRIMRFNLIMSGYAEVLGEIPIEYFNCKDLTILPFTGTLYWIGRTNRKYYIMQSDLDGKNIRSLQAKVFTMCPSLANTHNFVSIKIDVNTKKLLIYWLSDDSLIVTDINLSTCNVILQGKYGFTYLTFDETNIYISTYNSSIYVLNKKYFLTSVDDKFKYQIPKIKIFKAGRIKNLYVLNTSLQPYSARKFASDISSTPGILVMQYYLPFTLGLVAIITIICVYYFYCSVYRQRKKSNQQVLPPIMTDIELETLHEIPNSNVQLNTLYSPMLEYNLDKYVLTEIKREEIRLEKLLNKGAFGLVYQAKIKNLERPGMEIPAAIKMLHKDASSQEKKKFLEEARLMNHFRHKHVLRLLGVCSDEDSLLIVLELMENGDLLQYLKDSRKLQPSDSHALRLQDLFSMCEDIARGCCYLEDMRFVHRDLACRNCLISARDRENRIIKIGDFGLARDLKNDYYRKIGQGLLPICWMAPESLVVGIFTSKSDVWSFGVLMWEITSLGEHPYTGRTNLEVIDYVRAGGRLPMPLNCPPPLYELMLRCWNPANDRPNFKLCLENIIALRNDIEDTLLSPVDII
ncbi:Tyrosine-protein kinase transforming protein ros [Formica fusca]